MGGAGGGVADIQRSAGEGAGLSAGGEERSSSAVGGNALMEAIDITTNGRILGALFPSLPLSLSPPSLFHVA